MLEDKFVKTVTQQHTEEEELAQLEKENDKIHKRIADLEEEKQWLRKQIGGIKSGIAQREVCSSNTKEVARQEACSSNAKEVDVVPKSVLTAVNQVMNKDLVVIDEQNIGSAHLFKGRRYFGNDSKHKKVRDGWNHFYAEYASHKRACSEISRKEVQKRAKFIDNLATHISSPSITNIDEKLILYTELIRLNNETFRQSLEDSGFSLMETLTPTQAVNVQSLLRLPTNKVRNLRIILSNLNLNILPSEKKMRAEKAPTVSHVSATRVESGFIGLNRIKTDENVSPSPFVRVKDLKIFIEEIVKKDSAGFSDNEHFNGKWWLLFSGDKGGQHMKYHVEVINSLKAGSVDNVHIYCMFEATDSVENMRKVWHPYRNQIKHMMQEDFKFSDGKGMQIFLGGDYHFLDDNMGHQGSSATYPSALDKVTLMHLQNHEHLPHTPESCPIELRTVTDYLENYNENLADDRNNNNLNENGKYHFSVVGPMLFPLHDLSQVVPASLHIMLGFVASGACLTPHNVRDRAVDIQFTVRSL